MRHVLCLAFAVVALNGCASEKPSTSTSTSTSDATTNVDAVKTGPTGETAAEHEARLAQALIDLDGRIDRYVTLSSQPGDEARSERRLLGDAITAQVGQFGADLLALAKDPSNEQRRRVAVKALGFSKDPAAVPALVAVLDRKEGDIRLLTNATFALGRLHDPSTPTDPLLDLAREADPDVRSNALLALWRIFEARRAIGASPLDPVSQPRALTILEPALFDPADPLIRAHAAAAMGALGDPRAVDPLISMLRDAHPLVRMQTAIALQKLGDAKAIPALARAIDDTPPGNPRTAVVLSLTALLEAHGVTIPQSLGQDGRAWQRFVQDQAGALQK